MDQPPPPHAPAAPPPHAPPPAPYRALLAWLLLIVPAAGLLFAYVLPTLDTVTMSVQSVSFLGGTGEHVGARNYSTVLGDATLAESLVLAAGLGIAAAVGGAVLAFLAAWCVQAAGHGVRTAARVVAALAAVAFAPAAWSVGLLAARYDAGPEAGFGSPADWNSWAGLSGGVVFGIGLLVGLAAFRGGAAGRRVATVCTAAGLTALALTATGLQVFSFSAVTLVDPQTPLHHLFRLSYQIGELGVGAALSVLLLVPLALLGLGAGFLFIGTRVHLDVDPRIEEPRGFRAGPGAGAIVLLALFATGALMGLWPWLSHITEGPVEPYDTASVVANTWGPALVATAAGFAAALAGAIAIGTLRPLGDHSLWLLLPFAPWLFVGTGPLALADFEALRDSGDYGTFMGMVPRSWIAVPALFLLTALCWGLERRRRAMLADRPPGAATAAVLKAGWPMAALVALAVLVANAQDSYWQAVSGSTQDPNAWGAMSVELSGSLNFDGAIGTAVAYPLTLLVPFAIAACAAAVWYLPKVALRIGK